MASHAFSEPCSGRDCLVCGPLPTPEDQAYASLDYFPESLAADHQIGLHDPRGGYGGWPHPDCPICFPPHPRPRHEALLPLDPDDDLPF
jgi:hypothetical protein